MEHRSVQKLGPWSGARARQVGAAVQTNLERRRNTEDAGQPARDDHHSRTALSRTHQDCCPAGGLGRRHSEITAWLDASCGADGWALTPSGMRGALDDAISIYFADATLASAFVARRCVGSKVETAGGVFQVREDEPAPRIGAGLNRTPLWQGTCYPASARSEGYTLRGWRAETETTAGCSNVEECVRSGGHWNGDPQLIIAQRRYAPESSGRKQLRFG